MASRATDPTYPSPWQSEEALRSNREAVSRQISNAMKSYMMSKG